VTLLEGNRSGIVRSRQRVGAREVFRWPDDRRDEDGEPPAGGDAVPRATAVALGETMRRAFIWFASVLVMTGCRSLPPASAPDTGNLAIGVPPSVVAIILEREKATTITAIGNLAYRVCGEHEFLFIDGWCRPQHADGREDSWFWYLLQKELSDRDWRNAKFGVVGRQAMDSEEVIQALMGDWDDFTNKMNIVDKAHYPY